VRKKGSIIIWASAEICGVRSQPSEQCILQRQYLCFCTIKASILST
jgi:hypothetical protein